MENPATWGEAEKLIRQVLHEDHAMKQDGQVVLGLSLERRVADALRAEGLLLQDPASLDDVQLDAYISQLDEHLVRVLRENNKRAARKLLAGGCPWAWDAPQHVHHACALDRDHGGSHACGSCEAVYR